MISLNILTKALYEYHCVKIEICDNSSECYKLFLESVLLFMKNFLEERRWN